MRLVKLDSNGANQWIRNYEGLGDNNHFSLPNPLMGATLWLGQHNPESKQHKMMSGLPKRMPQVRVSRVSVIGTMMIVLVVATVVGAQKPKRCWTPQNS